MNFASAIEYSLSTVQLAGCLYRQMTAAIIHRDVAKQLTSVLAVLNRIKYGMFDFQYSNHYRSYNEQTLTCATVLAGIVK